MFEVGPPGSNIRQQQAHFNSFVRKFNKERSHEAPANSHLPFRRRERAMLRFRQMRSLQKFASVHANLHNHFSHERHLVDR